ncbi:hypothetical protein SAMN04488103_103196 [Gemmobacter aquatilis]|uniref:Uncharacterized protein n=1 Tax=Gemmobacter aquatilis TaxID=933059 RepID=A0A1H8E2A1_9RHOB|nr:hypothetical protein [Gemmobacter aquatilis]SEN13565.1 hypothetical protein SAMN04488103_103196 [Gemmobacter aquatilis]
MKVDVTRAFLTGAALWLLVPGTALALPMVPPGGITLPGQALNGPLVRVTTEDEATSEEGSVGDPATDDTTDDTLADDTPVDDPADDGSIDDPVDDGALVDPIDGWIDGRENCDFCRGDEEDPTEEPPTEEDPTDISEDPVEETPDVVVDDGMVWAGGSPDFCEACGGVEIDPAVMQTFGGTPRTPQASTPSAKAAQGRACDATVTKTCDN